MIIDEKYLREIIRSSIIKEIGFGKVSTDVRSGESGSQSSSEDATQYSGPLITDVGGKKYLGNPKTGISPPGFWDSFRNRLESYININYPKIGIKIDNLGVTRDLAAASNANNPDRASGSKHGAGLAQDVYFHTAKKRFTNYRTDNARLAKDKKLVNTIIKFMEMPENNKILWGGTFGGGGKTQDSLPQGHGIVEFHHFEFKNEFLPEFFEPYKDELVKIGIQDVSSIKSTKDLANIYNKLLSGSPTQTDSKEDSGQETKVDQKTK